MASKLLDAVAHAHEAEAREDWPRAAMWWNYAAQALDGNPSGLRTEYCRREDAAKAKCGTAAPPD